MISSRPLVAGSVAIRVASLDSIAPIRRRPTEMIAVRTRGSTATRYCQPSSADERSETTAKARLPRDVPHQAASPCCVECCRCTRTMPNSARYVCYLAIQDHCGHSHDRSNVCIRFQPVDTRRSSRPIRRAIDQQFDSQRMAESLIPFARHQRTRSLAGKPSHLCRPMINR